MTKEIDNNELAEIIKRSCEQVKHILEKLDKQDKIHPEIMLRPFGPPGGKWPHQK